MQPRVRLTGSGRPGKELVFVLRGSRPKWCFIRKLWLLNQNILRVGAGKPVK